MYLSKEVDTMNKDEDLVRITLRLPKGLWKQLKESSKENDRSLNSEILNILKNKKVVR